MSLLNTGWTVFVVTVISGKIHLIIKEIQFMFCGRGTVPSENGSLGTFKQPRQRSACAIVQTDDKIPQGT